MSHLKKELLSSTTASVDPLKRDFRRFLLMVWRHLGLPDPTPVQYEIAAFLQHGPDRRVIQAFRGVGKSWVTSAYVVWRLYCDPKVNILVISASKSRSDDFSTFTLRLINEIPILAHLKPGDDQRNSKIAFDVGPAPASHSPSVKSVGITGQITGSRADEIVADDIEVANNSDTQHKRDKLAEQVKEFDAIVKPGDGMKVTFLGTPQSEASLYNLLPERGYTVRIWPAEMPAIAKMHAYGRWLAPSVRRLVDEGVTSGTPLDSKRFNAEDLAKRRLSFGRAGYALQFMLDTSLSDADKYPLKLNDLMVMALDPEKGPTEVTWGSSRELALGDLQAVGLPGDHYVRPIWIDTDMAFQPWQATIMAVDPSGRGKDETAYAVVSLLNARLFLRAAGGFRGGMMMRP